MRDLSVAIDPGPVLSVEDRAAIAERLARARRLRRDRIVYIALQNLTPAILADVQRGAPNVDVFVANATEFYALVNESISELSPVVKF